MQLIWQYLKPFKKTLLGALVLAAINQFFSLLDPQIFRLIIDQYASRIKILVAHRLSTIAHANRIYVLERGKIAEIGNHQELLNKNGLYYALWREQQAE